MEAAVNMLSNVPTFILKLWKMLESKSPEIGNIMRWSSSGTSFIIRDKIAFITKLLPMYFKHNNMGSFVRQLNLYDFHKIYARANSNELEYQHKYFKKGSPETLNLIKRKLPRMSRSATTQASLELSSISKELSTVKTKQDAIMRQMTSLQRENLNLLKDLKTLHVRQNNQTQALTNILELLVPYVQNYQQSHSSAPKNNALNSGGLFNTDEDIISKLNAINHINEEENADLSFDENALIPKRSADLQLMINESLADFDTGDLSDEAENPPSAEDYKVEEMSEEPMDDIFVVENQDSLDEISRFLQGDDAMCAVAFDIDSNIEEA